MPRTRKVYTGKKLRNVKTTTRRYPKTKRTRKTAYGKRKVYRKTYRKRSVRRVYRKSYGKGVKGPKPAAVRFDKKAMRELIAVNQLYRYVITDGAFFNQTAANVTYTNSATIGIASSLTAPDINTLCGLIPTSLKSPNGNGYSDYICLVDSDHEFTFTSNDVSDIMIKYWILVPRRDVPIAAQAPDKAWQTGVESADYGNQTTTPSTAGGYTNPASRPDDSPLFNEYYAVISKSVIKLAPGASKMIKMRQPNLPHMMQQGADGVNPYAVQGITKFILFQALGAPVSVATLDSPPVISSVGFSPPQFNIMQTRRYKFTYTSQPYLALKYSVTPGQGTVTQNQQNFINPTSGLPYGNYNAATLVNTGNASIAVSGTGGPQAINQGTVGGPPLVIQGTGSLSKLLSVPTQVANQT